MTNCTCKFFSSSTTFFLFYRTFTPKFVCPRCEVTGTILFKEKKTGKRNIYDYMIIFCKIIWKMLRFNCPWLNILQRVTSWQTRLHQHSSLVYESPYYSYFKQPNLSSNKFIKRNMVLKIEQQIKLSINNFFILHYFKNKIEIFFSYSYTSIH